MAYSIVPWLNVRDSGRALQFYKVAFDAVEVYRIGDETSGLVARLSLNGAEFWMGDESPEHANHSPQTVGGSTTRLIFTVPDPASAFARAIAAGARAVYPVSRRHGWTIGRVVDPFGHHWEIGCPEDSSPE